MSILPFLLFVLDPLQGESSSAYEQAREEMESGHSERAASLFQESIDAGSPMADAARVQLLRIMAGGNTGIDEIHNQIKGIQDPAWRIKGWKTGLGILSRNGRILDLHELLKRMENEEKTSLGEGLFVGARGLYLIGKKLEAIELLQKLILENGESPRTIDGLSLLARIYSEPGPFQNPALSVRFSHLTEQKKEQKAL